MLSVSFNDFFSRHMKRVNVILTKFLLNSVKYFRKLFSQHVSKHTRDHLFLLFIYVDWILLGSQYADCLFKHGELIKWFFFSSSRDCIRRLCQWWEATDGTSEFEFKRLVIVLLMLLWCLECSPKYSISFWLIWVIGIPNWSEQLMGSFTVPHIL